MKRFSCLILFSFFTFYLVGCGAGNKPQTQSGTQSERPSRQDQPTVQSRPSEISQLPIEDLRKNCTLPEEKSERRNGLILSSNCYEVGRSKGPQKDYFNAVPGVGNEILSLSTDDLTAFKTEHGATRIDLTLIPKSSSNKTFADFKSFNADLQNHQDHFVAIFRNFAKIVDLMGLNTYGYRVVIDERPQSGLPFHFRVFGGEPLGNTVQLAGGPVASHETIIDINAPYNPSNSFIDYINETSTAPSYKIHQVGAKKAFTFDDTSPQATVHMLAIPRGPFVSSYDFFKHASGEEIASLFKGVSQIIADNAGKGTGGFRLITNAGFDANQSVGHFHVHVIRGNSAMHLALGAPAVPARAHRVIKTYNIYEVIAHINPETLAVFDVDSTLIWVPGHTWPYPEVSAITLAEGPNTSRMWQALLARTTNNASTPGAKYVLLTARNAHAPVNSEMAAAGLNMIWLWASSFTPSFNNGLGKGFLNGALYAAHSPKSQIYLQFTSEAHATYPFKNTVIVDDRWENVDDLKSIKANTIGIARGIVFWYQGAINPTTRQLID